MFGFRRIRNTRMKLAGIISAAVLVAGAGTFAVVHLVGSEDRDGDADIGELEGDGDADAGGPQAPADFLDVRFTSHQEVTDQQVQQAVTQAAGFAENGNTWRLVGPANVGGPDAPTRSMSRPRAGEYGAAPTRVPRSSRPGRRT
jgi:hypothetical protein